MSLPKVVIKDHFDEYLNGVEVKAFLVDSVDAPLQPGEHVIAFKDSLAATTDIPVPKQQQAHYIGVEGAVTHTEVSALPSGSSVERQQVMVKKV
jgi:hypothetical protein